MYKNNNKKLISYLMALIMVLAFAGCKTDNKPDDMKIQRTVYIEVVNESSNYNKQYELKTEKETLGEALEELGKVKFESGAYGKYITLSLIHI